MEPRKGVFVIADISGYTAFIAGTELQHSREIITELMEVMVRSVTPQLRVVQVEGDAIFCIGDQVGEKLAGMVGSSFLAFHRRVRDIRAVTTCPCQACVSVGTLTLKFVSHFGSYMPQRIAKRDIVVGADVNLTHRLLKNRVPSREYVLATTAVLERLPPSDRATFVPHTESYPDTEAIEAGYRDLAELRQRAYAEERHRVASEEARQAFAHDLDAPLADVWHIVVDPDERRRWFRQDSIELRTGARGTLYGAEYHCRHEKRLTVLRVVGVDEPNEFTEVFPIPLPPFGDMYMTQRLTALGPTRTRREVFLWWESGRGLVARLRDAVFRFIGRDFTTKSIPVIRARLSERRAARGPS